jgi:hypothetical protein
LDRRCFGDGREVKRPQQQFHSCTVAASKDKQGRGAVDDGNVFFGENENLDEATNIYVLLFIIFLNIYIVTYVYPPKCTHIFTCTETHTQYTHCWE